MTRLTEDILAKLLQRPGYRVRTSGTAPANDVPKTPAVAGEAQDVAPKRAQFCLELPFPPSVNHFSMPDGKGGRILTEKTREYRRKVQEIVDAARPTAIGRRFRFELELHYPDKRRRDADNHIKQILDALQQAAVVADDAWLRELWVKVFEARTTTPGLAVVTVTEIE